jgi:ABC-type multidrug transport system ATPase subunit
MASIAIEAAELSKTYRRFWRRPVPALDGLSLRLRSGERLGLLGPAGSGKTTFVNVLRSRTQPDSGSVRIFGKPPARASSFAYCTGAAFLQESFTLRHELLVIDEPFRNASEADRRVILQRLTALGREGATMLLCSRRLADVGPVCTEVAVLDAGRVAAHRRLNDRGNPDGLRVLVTALPEALQERLTSRGLVIRWTGPSCWIELFDRGEVCAVIEEVRASGGWVQGVEEMRPQRGSR